MYLGNQPVSGAFQKLDNISAGFNGTQTIFPLASNSVAVVAGTPQNLIISISGVVQEPGVSYYVAGSTIVFNEAPLVTDSFFGILMGTVGEVSVSGSAATGPAGNPVFWENDKIVTGSYQITPNKNAGTFGPVTIADGAIVTVPVNSTWTIV